MDKFYIIDNFLENPNNHIDDIFSNPFIEVYDFKNIQDRKEDIISNKIIKLFPDYLVNYNFARLSPLNQVEPNNIHSDEVMGDLTCILYLNKSYPENNGTTLFMDDEKTKSIDIKGIFNRMFIFESRLKHCRTIFENFGEGKDARLIQVLFLNKN